ncbi:MAG: DUF5009 domain-containing protein, partial [Pedobacter sp.]|nr:DUF5009 domain-containing protein [Pedobacter sp.]
LQFPINKALWTSSFVLYAGGIATMILSLCYWIIDVQQYTKFTKPFVVYGVNAITVFFASGLIPRILNMISWKAADGSQLQLTNYLYSGLEHNLSPLNASLAWAVCFVLFWLVILWFMYKKNIIIKV